MSERVSVDTKDGPAKPGSAERESRRAGWRLMYSAVRPQRWWVAGGVGAGVIWTLAKLTVPLLAAAAIDDGVRNGDSGKVVTLTIAIVLVGVVQAISTGLRRYAAFRIALRTETDLRQRLFAHLQRLHFAFHDQAADRPADGAARTPTSSRSRPSSS